MYELFEPDYPVAREKISYLGSLDYVRRAYAVELNRVSNYFEERVFAVPSSHLLCQIITHADKGTNLEGPAEINALFARAPYVARNFGLATEGSFPQPLRNVFLQEREFAIYVEPTIKELYSVKSYKDFNPVRVLWTNSIDYTLAPPNGKNHPLAEHYAIYSIDIISLVMMYRRWRLHRKAYSESYDLEVLELGPEHFICQAVLPQMVKDILDLSVINHAIALNKSETVKKESSVKLAMSTYDNSARIENCIRYYLEHYRDNQLTYETYLWNIPTVVNTNGFDAFKMPSVMKTIQVNWLLLLSRLRLMKFIIELGGETGMHLNYGLITRLSLACFRLKRENVIDRMLPGPEAKSINHLIDKFIDYGRS
jgi:hypothetical protein